MPLGRVTEAPTKLGTILRQRGLTVAWLQQQLGVSRAFAHELVWGRVSKYSQQKWAPRIAEALGMSEEEVFGQEVGDGEPQKNGGQGLPPPGRRMRRTAERRDRHA